MNSNHSFWNYYLEINVNITLPFTFKSSKMSLSFRFLHQTPVRTYIPTQHLFFITRNILTIITNYEAYFYVISFIPLIPSLFPFAPQGLQPSFTIMSNAMQCSPWACPEGIQWETNYSYTHSLNLTPEGSEWLASGAGRLIPGERKSHWALWIETEWAPKQFWIFLEKRKLHYSSQESNPGLSNHRPSHNTDYSIPSSHTHAQTTSKITALCSRWIL